MTLVVAQRDNSNLYIVSDTKLTYSADSSTPEQIRQPNLFTDGTIKTIVLNANTSLSFAGNVEYAREAIRGIHNDMSIDDVSSYLTQIHNASNFETEFIFCSCGDTVKILEIKQGQCSVVDTAWIGSPDAFKRFQAYRLKQLKRPQANSDTFAQLSITPQFDKGDSQTFKDMDDAMKYLIEDKDIPEVSGFRVLTTFEGGSFGYRSYNDSFIGQMIFHGFPGVQPITHGTAANGGYTVNFYRVENRYDCIAIHIMQGEFGILYTRKSEELFEGEILKMDEVDFSEYVRKEFDIHVTMASQDKETKFLKEGIEKGKAGRNEEAIELFMKALDVPKGKMIAHINFNIALSYLNLNKMNDAGIYFQKAVNIDPKLTPRAQQEMMKKSNRSR